MLRQGRPYESLETVQMTDARTGEALAVLSQANPGLVTRDLARWPESQTLEREQMRRVFETTADSLLDASDPDNHRMAERVAATTGLTTRQVVGQVARLATAIRALVAHMATISVARAPVAFVLPSNAPGVHSAWLTALALGRPVALKPGTREPWTPYRLAELLRRAGLPETMIGIYPGDHATSRAIIQSAQSCVVFGDEATVERYHEVASVDVRGPGRSKALVTAEASRDPNLVARLADAVTEFGGRSCLNTSSIGVVNGSMEDVDTLREALSDAMGSLETDSLAAWPSREQALGIASWLGELGGDSAEPELALRSDGLWALVPRAVAVSDWRSELASLEAPCPWVGVAGIPEPECAGWVHGALAVSVHGSAEEAELLGASLWGVDRLVPAGSVTTDATDITYHVEALRRLEP